MWTRQREDGGWEWPFRDTPPIKSDEHYGVVLAALAASAAPENYSASEPARKGLAGIRKFLTAHPPRSLHQKGMLLWGNTHIRGSHHGGGKGANRQGTRRGPAARRRLVARQSDGESERS